MVTRNSVWVSVCGGFACLALGATLGVAWSGRQPAPVWSDAPPIRTAGAVPSFAEVVQRTGPGVVTVCGIREGAATDPTIATAGQPGGLRAVHSTGPGMRSGSGFVVDARGLVLTSRHVVVGASIVEGIVPGHGRYRCELVGEDRATDLALLRLVAAPEGLCVLPMATGNDLRAGDWIVAVGNPLDFAQTVTAGIVSYVGRHLHHSDFGVTNDFLQISAPVNPGSSGCPVLDLHGRVVGVTTQAPVDAQGISFAVPGRTVKWALEEMLRAPDGRVRRGYLGIEFASRGGVDRTGVPFTGAVILDVKEGDPAHRAGVRAGDVVVRVDDVPVVDASALHQRIVSARPGTAVALQVLRDGREDAADSIVAVLGELGVRPADSPN